MGAGKTEIIVSGGATTNSYVYNTVNVLGYGETSVFFQNNGTAGSGIAVTVLGYPAYESLPITSAYVILVSGDVVESGKVYLYSVSDSYEGLGVGYKSAGTNFSGRVTIVVTRKRRQ